MISLKSFKLINDNEIDDLDDTRARRHHHHQHQHQQQQQQQQQAVAASQEAQMTAGESGSGTAVGGSDRIRILQQQERQPSAVAGTFTRDHTEETTTASVTSEAATHKTIGNSESLGATFEQVSRDKNQQSGFLAGSNLVANPAKIIISNNHIDNNNSFVLSPDNDDVEPNNNKNNIVIASVALSSGANNENNNNNNNNHDDNNDKLMRGKNHHRHQDKRARGLHSSEMGANSAANERAASAVGAHEQAASAATAAVAAVAITLPLADSAPETADQVVPATRATNIDNAQQEQEQQRRGLMTNSPTPTQASSSASSSSSSSSISIVVVRHNDTSKSVAVAEQTGQQLETTSTASDIHHHHHHHHHEQQQHESGDYAHHREVHCATTGSQQSTVSSDEPASLPSVNSSEDQARAPSDSSAGRVYKSNLLAFPVSSSGTGSNGGKRSMAQSDTEESRLSVTTESEHFEIVWSNLSYRIEPKWYKKFNYVSRLLSHFAPSGQTVDPHSSATSTASSQANMNDDQHQMHAQGGGASSASGGSQMGASGGAGSGAESGASSLEPIEIFTNLNGTIRSGQMTAVLGPSGAGKTTLLNCLTGKLRNGVSGHINLKGANGKHLKMCTIPQKDHLLEQLTVEENLWFASKIKNPEYGFDHAKNIERVIDLLGLKRCRTAKIKKISGGQHKRVSIAQELLSNPDILVLDEPTSGLDSLTCFKTISMLRDLVELSANNDFMKPMAIIVTIHQPQPKVFNLFHHVYILANGGRVIYEGAPADSLDTITNVTCLSPIDSSKSTSLTPGAVDPASFLIEIASEEYGLEVINTLSDYQRNAFYESNNARETKRHNEHMRKHGSRGGKKSPFCKSSSSHIISNNNNNNNGTLCGQENAGFTPGFGNNNKLDCQQQQLAANGNYIASTNLEISCTQEDNQAAAGSNSNGNRKCKRRKRSVYSLDRDHQEASPSPPSDKQHKQRQQQQQQQQRESSHHKINFGASDQNLYLSEQLLYTRVPNHRGRFWSHTATLTHRTLLTIRRDPLLMTSRVLFHLMIPILMGHVYGKATGAANACPHYEPEIDITQIPSLVENKRIESMLEELHMSIENVSMFFIIMYAFAAAVLALNALSFPLNMQVLLKETRNGWYSMSSYVLAKTLADLPLELTMPCMTMALVYPLTGQPSSYLQWRMLTICLIMTLCSLIAQTQALILGALVMNSVQTAVFVSQASQLPWVILAGFTIRIKRLSEPLKLISLTSFYRLGCEAITLTRYGFGICPCNPQEITGQPVRLVGIPDQLRTVAQYWLDSMEASKATNDTSVAGEATLDEEMTTTMSTSLVAATTTTTMMPSTSANVDPQAPKTDIFQHLANQLSYANSYGVNITSCDDVAPDRIRAINLGDNWLVARIWHLFIMLIIMKIILYYAVRFSIGIRL